VYLNLVLAGGSRSNRFSWKKMCIEYSRTELCGNVWGDEMFVSGGGFIVSQSYRSAFHFTQDISCSPFSYCPDVAVT
jgi:hypothetical protein